MDRGEMYASLFSKNTKSLGDVIGEVLERAESKKRKTVKSKPSQKTAPVQIIYEQKDFSVKGRKQPYHIFALEVSGMGRNKIVSKVKQIGYWSGIKELSGKTVVNYAVKGKRGKNVSREIIAEVVRLFSKGQENAIKVGIDGKSVLLEDREYFEGVLG